MTVKNENKKKKSYCGRKKKFFKTLHFRLNKRPGEWS